MFFYYGAKVMLKTETAIGITLNCSRENRLLRRLSRSVVVILLIFKIIWAKLYGNFAQKDLH